MSTYLRGAGFLVPFICRYGLASMKTRHPVLHLLRFWVSVMGVQAFTQAFAAAVGLAGAMVPRRAWSPQRH